MSEILYYGLALLLASGVLAGIAMMSKVRTAYAGNLLSAGCMAAAIVLTLYKASLLSQAGLLACMALGLALGALSAYRARMIQMPQAIALLNGLGGVASAIVGAALLLAPSAASVFSSATAALAVVIGALTLAGSLIAAGKLRGVLSQRPMILGGHVPLAIASLVFALAFVVFLAAGMYVLPALILCALLSCCFGVLLVIRVGGADMPIAISLLTSLSGVAAGMTGLAIADPLVVAIGGIASASGLFLTQAMCRAMNRGLWDILLGKTYAKPAVPEISADPIKTEDVESLAAALAKVFRSVQEPPMGSANTPESASLLLAQAARVIIAPGYGMALAQAQAQTKHLADMLEAAGTEVKYAIHPVAGRMPGHMNVLLAEAGIPYDQLYAPDDINPEFASCDVCLIIGANEVINPAAKTAEGTPIYGMPVLAVEGAKHIIICNQDTSPGYSGVDNPLYTKGAGVTLMLGDAKESLETLAQGLMPETSEPEIPEPDTQA